MFFGRRIRAGIFILGLFAVSSVFAADGFNEAPAGGWPSWYGSGEYPPNFAELCSFDLPPKRQAAFDESLAAAEAAAKRDDFLTVQRSLENMGLMAYRGQVGREKLDYRLSYKCLGKPTYQRVFDVLLAYQGGKKVQGRAPYWVIAAEAGAQGLADQVIGQRSSPGAAVGYIAVVVEEYDWERNFGAYLLPDEQRIKSASEDAIKLIEAHAKRMHDEAMAAEEKAFNRPPTAQEIEMQVATQAMAGALVGMGDADPMLQKQRTGESLNKLGEARRWYISEAASGGNTSDSPESARARQRGITLLAKADDVALDVMSRDEYYEQAINYFEFGSWQKETAGAQAARARIAPDLEARKQQLEANQQQALAEMQRKADSAKQEIESMQKTEAEKKSFNEEADALEAELGF